MITSSAIQTCMYYDSPEYTALLSNYPMDFGEMYKFTSVANSPLVRTCKTRCDVYDDLAPEIKAIICNTESSGLEQLRTRMAKSKCYFYQSINRIKPNITFLSSHVRSYTRVFPYTSDPSDTHIEPCVHGSP